MNMDSHCHVQLMAVKKNAVMDSYLKHIKRKHNNFNQEHLSKSRDHARNDTILNLLVEVHEVAEYDHDHMGEEDIEIGETEIDFQKKIGVLSYIFEKKYKLPFIVIPQIIREFLAMICHHQAFFSHTLNQYLANSHMHINEQECNRLMELFEEKSDVENALLSLDSGYKLKKFARLKLNYIKPTVLKQTQGKVKPTNMFQYKRLYKICCHMMTYWSCYKQPQVK